MKPIKGLWEQIVSYENLLEAYKSAAKGKRFRPEVLIYTDDLEHNLSRLQSDLMNGTYKTGRYHEFYVYEPKKRLVMALPFYDRVAQWAIYRVLNPYLAKGYIKDSYACIDGRGIHAASARLKYFAGLIERENGGKGYYLKLDISKYFYRINHEVLLKLLRKRFGDRELISVLERIVCSDVPFGLPLGASPGESKRIYGVGMPIGNLTSQMFANFYLNELDQYIKRELKAHCYVRYMDDMIIVAKEKSELHEYRRKIERFLNRELKLNLNEKTTIRPLSLGIDFCGYKVWSTHIKLRKQTALKMKRRLKKLEKDYAVGAASLDDVKRTLASYNGALSHCDGYLLSREVFGIYEENGGEWYNGWFTLRRRQQVENESESRNVEQHKNHRRFKRYY